MTTSHEGASPAALSPRVERLKRAAADARGEADAALSHAIQPASSTAGIAAGVLNRVGAAGLRAAVGVLKRHPVSVLLIAGVLIGTVVYHRSPRARRARL